LTALQNDKSNNSGFSHFKAGFVREYQENVGDIYVEFIIDEDYKNIEKDLIHKHNPKWNKK